MNPSAMANQPHSDRPGNLWLRSRMRLKGAFLSTSRHTLAVFGLLVVLGALMWVVRPDFQANANAGLLTWLEKRHFQQTLTQRLDAEQTPASRSTATWTQDLNGDQLAVTKWLSRKYKISPEPMGALVTEAWNIGERSQIAPTLILSIMAVESRFNPFASGSQGAMGLMQIEPEAHTDALSTLGGRLAAFDPLTNLRVGTRFLQSMVLQTNTLEEALRLYGSASGQTNQDLYARRVLAEHQRLETISQAANVANPPSKGADTATAQAEPL